MAADSLLRLDLGLPRRLQLETAKLERQRARGSLVLLVQAKLRELLQQANLRTWARLRVKAKPPAANSRAIRRVLFQANSRVKTADPPSPGLRRAGWRPPLLEPQD